MSKKRADSTSPEETGPSTQELLRKAVPPQNLDAERAVLGSVLRNNDCLNDVIKRVRPEHFYGAANQKLFQTMREMFEEGHPIDALTLAERLNKKKLLKEVGGAPLIMELFSETLTAANVMYHANIVFEKAVLRHLIGTGSEILREAYSGSMSADDLLSEAERKIFALLQDRNTGETSTIHKVLGQVFSRISARQSGGAAGGVPSGFRDLDEMTNGWQKSELIILAARPAVGKTAFALNLADHAAVEHNIPTLFVSLEMSEIELAERMLCSRARVNGHLLRRGRVSSDDMSKLVAASGQLSSAPIFIDDTPGQTMLRITATARRLKLRFNLQFIIIDYLQLIEPDDRKVSRVEQIGAISRRLKTLSRELQVPVMALSQLNRSVESREGHRPRMADLRESGSIEQDADVVAMLHRDDAYDPDSPTKGVAEVLLVKQRNGPVGDIKLAFIKELTRFENLAQDIGAFSDADSEY